LWRISAHILEKFDTCEKIIGSSLARNLLEIDLQRIWMFHIVSIKIDSFIILKTY